jgi:hypothetical protein
VAGSVRLATTAKANPPGTARGPTDQELVARLVRGDEGAFRELVRLHDVT